MSSRRSRRRGRLREPDVVAERIAQRAVDAVRTLRRLLAELDTLRTELVVRLAAVVRREEQVSARAALRDEIADLRRGLVVHDRLAGPLDQDGVAVVSGYRHRVPAHEPVVLVVVHLEA